MAFELIDWYGKMGNSKEPATTTTTTKSSTRQSNGKPANILNFRELNF